MTTILAIAKTTIRSSLRSHVVHAILFFLALAIFILPLTIKGDGTAEGLLRVSLTYALSTVGFLLSAVTLWLGCTMITDDIEEYQAHLVLSKPVSRMVFWFGKLAGILVLQGALLAIAATAIFAITMWRFSSGDFSAEERETIRHELLVARKYLNPVEPPIDNVIEQEIERRQEAGYEKPENITDKMVYDTIRREVVGQLEEVRPWTIRPLPWEFQQLPQLDKDDTISLRFRFYVGNAKSKDQRAVRGRWWVFDERAQQVVPMPVTQYMGGVWHTLKIDNQFLSEQNQLSLSFENLDMFEQPIAFQMGDGPYLMMPVTSFLMNYLRVILLIFLQIAFLGIIGCACGALLSTPVALFLAFSYVIFGAVLVAMEPATPEDDIIPQNPFMRGLYIFRNLIKYVIVSVNEFNLVDHLTRGRLIEFTTIGVLASLILLLRGGIIAFLGIWLFNRRELGKVIRR